jgi:hypothetical protein
MIMGRRGSTGRIPPLIVRTARLVAVAVLIGWSTSQIVFRVSDWSLSDMDAYWNAAMRLRDGGALFPPLADVSAPDVYRYAPWFAGAWVPLTYLPKTLVGIGWSILLVGAVVLCVRPLLRTDLTSIAAAFFFTSFLVWGASIGNAQPLIIAGLMYTIDRRTGPLAVGMAASLKAVPILFLALYVGRQQWARAGLGLAVALSLSATFLLVDLAHYPATAGDAPSPLFAISPVLMGAGVVAMAALTVVLSGRRTPFDRLAAAGTALSALPRITLLDLPMLLVGMRPEPPEDEPSR